MFEPTEINKNNSAYSEINAYCQIRFVIGNGRDVQYHLKEENESEKIKTNTFDRSVNTTVVMPDVNTRTAVTATP